MPFQLSIIHMAQKTVSHVAGSGNVHLLATCMVNNIEKERERAMYVERSSIDLSIIRRQL